MTQLAIDTGRSWATLSPCGEYRYRLGRRTRVPNDRSVLFVMLNPSTADHTHDDQTIRRCIGFTERMGAGILDVVNLYAFRATDPSELHAAGARAVGPANHVAIRDAARQANRIIVAWGADPGPLPTQPAHVLDLLRAFRRVGATIQRLGKPTLNGAPRHPSRLPYAVRPVDYP